MKTRLLYPDSMPWGEEDETLYADLGEPEIDDTPVGNWERHVIDEGFNSHGVRTRLHFQDNEIITERTYDAEPYLKAAAEARANNQGKSWGDGFIRTGVIPPAEFGKMIREGSIHDDKYVDRWFKERPKLVHFEKALK